MAQIKQTFFQECEEQLAELETGLLALERAEADGETINAVFRAVHSIKGGAGAFSLDDLVRFSHVFETALDGLRTGQLTPTSPVLKTLLRAADVLADLVRAARDGGTFDVSRSLQLHEELENLTGAAPAPSSPLTVAATDAIYAEFRPVQVSLAALLGDTGAPTDPSLRTYTIRFKPKPALYAKANETILLLRELKRLGEASVECDTTDLPLLGELDPEGAYLAWTIHLKTVSDEASVREVFDFVAWDCDLEIRSDLSQAEMDDAIFENLMAQIKAESAPSPPVIESRPVAQRPRDEQSNKQQSEAKVEANPAGPVQATIRVDLDRVDRLIDLVGELVINQSMLSQRVSEAGLARSSAVAMGLDELEQLSREIQDSVMAIRAQPVKPVFQRMSRVVREVADMTGKSVRLITEGEGTEVDKTVIERLSDPLTHMLRNAIDHGLEKPEARLAVGKPECGVVRLTAAHRSGRIVIEVSDDGAGIDRARVKSIAVARKLIEENAPLSDEEIDNLIFLPSFSTAGSISNVSGRGVGMDVVKRSVQALGGRISIMSRPGEGSTFTLSLPLTLAVLDGMVVSVAGQTLVVPLTAIVETLQPKLGEVHSMGGDARVIAIRETFTPLIDVGQHLGYRNSMADPMSCVAVLVESEGHSRSALLVDAIQGQRQVVIKSLEANYRHVPGIAAATILGDGRVALILDVDTLVIGTRPDSNHLEPALQAAE
jgi:two-component system chemotaxis sensor kinase CheA